MATLDDEYLPRLVYQALVRFKQQLNPSAKQMLENSHENSAAHQETFSRMIYQQFGDVNLVILVAILALLCSANQDTFEVYEQMFAGVKLPRVPEKEEHKEESAKREEQLTQQLTGIENQLVKVQKENEEFRRANHRWAQDYEALRNRMGTSTQSAREKELEKNLRIERSNFDMLRGKYDLLEETVKDERTELLALRQQGPRNDDILARIEELERTLEDVNRNWEEDKTTKDRYRLERNRYYQDLDKQRRAHEVEKKRTMESIRNLESQCDRMRVAFAQVSDIVYPSKSTVPIKPTAKPAKRPSQKPPGHIPRGPMNCSDVERDLQPGRRDEQVIGLTPPGQTDMAHVIPCTTCRKDVPLDKFLEHMERCVSSS